MKNLSMSTIKVCLFIVLGFTTTFNSTFATTTMKLIISTGGDDLRGNGNQAYVTVNFANGTTSPEYALGGGFGNNTVVTKTVNLAPNLTSLSEIKNIVIRHNGSPRAGFPADTYDNWDLKALKVSFAINGTDQLLINESGNPLVRFTGQLRVKIFTPKTGGGDDDKPKTSTMKVFLTTGSDDLRGGNHAYMTVNYTEGTTSKEFDLGGGFGQNSLKTISINLGKEVADVSEIKSITIRHDGSPRSGQPFDSYDNWDLQSIRAALIYTSGVERNVINLNGNPLIRFTGALRVKTWLRM